MAELDEQGRPMPPSRGDESATLLGFLELQRVTFAWKTAGLDAAGLHATVGVSAMTLGGMLKHLALVEDYWCSQWLFGRDQGPPWESVDWDADPDWDWHSAAADTPGQLAALWQDSVVRSRSLVDEALHLGGLDGLAKRAEPNGDSPSLRWILFHLIEE